MPVQITTLLNFVIYCGLGIQGTLYHITCFTGLKINYPFDFFHAETGKKQEQKRKKSRVKIRTTSVSVL